MLTKQGHLLQAAHNERFFQTFDLDKTEFRDWAVTTAFYSALHWINAYLTTQNCWPTSHAMRDRAIGIYSVTRKIAPQYHELKHQSFNSAIEAFA